MEFLSLSVLSCFYLQEIRKLIEPKLCSHFLPYNKQHFQPELYKKDLVRQSSNDSSGGPEMEYCGKLHFALRYDKDVEGLIVKVKYYLFPYCSFMQRDIPKIEFYYSLRKYIRALDDLRKEGDIHNIFLQRFKTKLILLNDLHRNLFG